MKAMMFRCRGNRPTKQRNQVKMCSKGQKPNQLESKNPLEQNNLNMQQYLYPTFTFLKKRHLRNLAPCEANGSILHPANS